MDNINLKRFVDIDIKAHITSQGSGTRDTVVLFTPDGTLGNSTEFSSLSEAKALLDNTIYALTLSYLEVYFNNGGVKCLVIEGISYSTLTNDIITNLEDKYIAIAQASLLTQVQSAYSALKEIAQIRNTDSSIYGINEKIIICRSTAYNDTDSVKNFAVKYSNVLGAEMTIAAYLSQININKTNSVYDYSFTNENLTTESLNDEVFGITQENNYNVDISLANSSRNVGGNCKDGQDLTNNYVRIMLHQTLTERLINLLVSKIKGVSGISQIYNSCVGELEKYKYAGYLSTDKIWTDDTLNISYNEKTYTIISKGTALINGYLIKILPLSSLSDSDKLLKKAPPVYIIIADQYGIRKITINGEVI